MFFCVTVVSFYLACRMSLPQFLSSLFHRLSFRSVGRFYSFDISDLALNFFLCWSQTNAKYLEHAYEETEIDSWKRADKKKEKRYINNTYNKNQQRNDMKQHKAAKDDIFITIVLLLCSVWIFEPYIYSNKVAAHYHHHSRMMLIEKRISRRKKTI